MDLRRDRAEGPLVTGFRGRSIVIDGDARGGGVILTPTGAFDWDGIDIGDAAALDPLPEFIILGTGATLDRPSPRLIADYDESGIGIEVMDTRAAARAWAVLRAEGRWISAALRAL